MPAAPRSNSFKWKLLVAAAVLFAATLFGERIAAERSSTEVSLSFDAKSAALHKKKLQEDALAAYEAQNAKKELFENITPQKLFDALGVEIEADDELKETFHRLFFKYFDPTQRTYYDFEVTNALLHVMMETAAKRSATFEVRKRDAFVSLVEFFMQTMALAKLQESPAFAPLPSPPPQNEDPVVDAIGPADLSSANSRMLSLQAEIAQTKQKIQETLSAYQMLKAEIELLEQSHEAKSAEYQIQIQQLSFNQSECTRLQTSVADLQRQLQLLKESGNQLSTKNQKFFIDKCYLEVASFALQWADAFPPTNKDFQTQFDKSFDQTINNIDYLKNSFPQGCIQDHINQLKTNCITVKDKLTKHLKQINMYDDALKKFFIKLNIVQKYVQLLQLKALKFCDRIFFQIEIKRPKNFSENLAKMDPNPQPQPKVFLESFQAFMHALNPEFDINSGPQLNNLIENAFFKADNENSLNIFLDIQAKLSTIVTTIKNIYDMIICMESAFAENIGNIKSELLDTLKCGKSALENLEDWGKIVLLCFHYCQLYNDKKNDHAFHETLKSNCETFEDVVKQYKVLKEAYYRTITANKQPPQ